jgi:endonuclease/exonuclease/phosphatase family metal-dependent hydrolase
MLSLFLASAISAGAAPAVPISVMSFNIRYGTANDGPDRWEVRAPRTHEVIRRHKSDVIGLQEALDFQITEILAKLPGYESIGVGRDDGKKAGEYSSILYDSNKLRVLDFSTFWLSDTPSVVASKTWGNNITRICTVARFEQMGTRRKFYVFNTHLDHQSQPSREKSVALILQRIKDREFKDPVIVTGDFNAGEDNGAVKAMKSGGFADTWRVLNPTAPQPGTFNGFNELFESNKIDYVFADSGWKVLKAEVVMDKFRGKWPSDHMPVTAELGFK